MKGMSAAVVLLFLFVAVHAVDAAASPTPAPAPSNDMLRWNLLPPIPDAHGFAGPFAGISGGALLVTGGANFPDKPSYDGGTKTWYDDIYILDRPDGAWKKTAEKLPRPLGYGVSITASEGVICIGGSDARQHYADVFVLSYDGQKITRRDLPPLPAPCANMTGALVGRSIYIAGGLASPTAPETMRTFWRLDLDDVAAGWRTLEPWPGRPRMLAVAGARDGDFFLFSGADLVTGEDGKPTRQFLTDAYRYRVKSGEWQRMADLPRPAVAAPSPAAALGSAHLLIVGGDDGANFFRQAELRDKHPGFPADVLGYHTITDTWAVMSATPTPLVTTNLVRWRDAIVIPGGEIRPGVRSTAVLSATPVKQSSTFGYANLLTLGLYPLIMLAIGFWCARRKKDTNDFFRGGQKIPAWAAGLSIYATMLSSMTFMAIPARVYASDWAMWLNYVSIVLLAPLIIRVYLPFFRQLNVTSAYEYLERRFNLLIRLFGSASFIIYQVGRTAFVLYLPALALATVSNLDMTWCIVGMAILSILLTVFGGMEAVIWTDVAQTIILLGAVIASLIVVMLGIEGGVGGFMTAAHENAKFFEDVSWAPNLAISGAFVAFFGQLFTNLISYTSNQEVVQRYVTTEDTRAAGRAIWTNALISVPSGILFFAMGTALFVFYKQHPASLDPTIDNDAIFPLFMVRELPPGVAGLVVAGIFAAAQPTSGLNSTATAFTTDFYRRLVPGVTDRQALRMGRVMTVVTGVAGTAVALSMVAYEIKSIWDTFLTTLGLTTGILAGLFALGIVTKRANGKGATLGMFAAVGVMIWTVTRSEMHGLMYGAVGVISSFVLGYLLSLPFGADRELDGLTIHTRRA